MTETKIFVDTNGLVYAHDTAAGQKGDMASEAILELCNTETGVVSTQVLQELFVSLTQKFLFQLIGGRPAL